MYLWCDIEQNIVTELLIEPEFFSPYGGTFDTLWFSFCCDSEHVMKFDRVLGQFLVRSNERLLQNISKDRSSRPELFLRKFVLKICSKFTEDTHAEVQFQ